MSRILFSCIAVAVLGWVATSSAAAQDLDRILERDKIAAQKLKVDVDYALTQSRKLEKIDSGRATDLLQETITKVRNATEIQGDERVRHLTRLQARLREVTAAAQERTRADEDAARRAETKIRQEARETAGAKSPPPNQGPASVASKFFESRNAALASNDKLRAERAGKNLDALANVQKGATGQTEVLELSKDWARISERGKQKLTEKEVAMLKALNSVMSVNFERAKLSQVIEDLQNRAGMTILVDEGSLKDANPPVDLYEEAVNLKVSKVTVRTILRKLLGDRGLAYVLKDGMVQVVTKERAREMMVVRAYPVNDLVAVDNPLFWGPVLTRALTLQNAQRLIDQITASVEPSQWNTQNGPGSITYSEATMSLIIRASAEMHYQLGGGIVSR